MHFCNTALDLGNPGARESQNVNWRPNGNPDFEWSSKTSIVVVLSKRANSFATGGPSIAGTKFRSELTTNPSSLDDANGLENAVYTYQWFRVNGPTETKIPGDVDTTYTLTEADIGRSIKVVTNFTDDDDYGGDTIQSTHRSCCGLNLLRAVPR